MPTELNTLNRLLMFGALLGVAAIIGCTPGGGEDSVRETQGIALPSPEPSHAIEYRNLTDQQLAEVIAEFLRESPILYVGAYVGHAPERAEKFAGYKQLAADLSEIDTERLYEAYLAVEDSWRDSTLNDGSIDVASNLPVLTRLLFDVPEGALPGAPTFWGVTGRERGFNVESEINYLYPLRTHEGELRLSARVPEFFRMDFSFPAEEYEYFMSRYPRRSVGGK